MNEQLFEDIFSILDRKGPVLISDLIDTLRAGRFGGYAGTTPSGKSYNVATSGWGRRDFESDLESAGFITRQRKHGAGSAIYVHHSDFSTVIDGRGNLKEVH